MSHARQRAKAAVRALKLVELQAIVERARPSRSTSTMARSDGGSARWHFFPGSWGRTAPRVTAIPRPSPAPPGIGAGGRV